MLAPEAFPPDRWGSEVLVNTWPCPGCCLPCNTLLHPLRKAVSVHKRRIRQDGFDLDMTYITDRIIVMGFPATGIEHLYRNPRYECRRFLEKRHKGHYKVYNLACEPGRGYPAELFDGRVERYPFRDHGVPPLETMVEATNSAQRYLDADPENVVVFHCKAGKGRAGLLACCMLVRCGAFDTAADAIAHYNKVRVYNGKGLTMACQIKYVKFFERLWRETWGVHGSLGCINGVQAAQYEVPKQPRLLISSVRLDGLREHDKAWRPRLVVQVHRGTQFDPIFIAEARRSGQGFTFSFSAPVPIEGNFRVTVLRIHKGLCRKLVLIELWDNTAFLDMSAGELNFSLAGCDLKKKLGRRLTSDSRIVLRVIKAAQQLAAVIPADDAAGDVQVDGVALTGQVSEVRQSGALLTRHCRHN